jgi:general secretion pathway protein A
MYARHFRLSAEPFGITPDPSYVYLGPEHREALAALQYGLIERRGFITLIGEVGTGKTTLLYTLLSRLGPDVRTAYVAYTAQPFVDLLAAALKDFGVEVRADASKRQLLDALNGFLREQEQRGMTTALLIDEAQNVSDETFEELRLLSNFETYERKLLQIVLVGQPELWQRLSRPHLRQLRERVTVRARIDPLTPPEVRRYIEHRLQRAGGTTCTLFSPCAVRVIVRRSQGIPRRVNNLCHNALLFAYGRDAARVTARMAREVRSELNEGGSRRLPGWLERVVFVRTAAQRLTAAAAAVLVAAVVWYSVSAGLSPAIAVKSQKAAALAPAGPGAPHGAPDQSWLDPGAFAPMPHVGATSAPSTNADYELERLVWSANTPATAAPAGRKTDGRAVPQANLTGEAAVAAGAERPAESAPEGAAVDAAAEQPGPGAPHDATKVAALTGPTSQPEKAEPRVVPPAGSAPQPRKAERASVPPAASGRPAPAAGETAEKVVVKRVLPGATVYSIGREVYAARGERFNASEFLAAVKRFNPGIGDLDRVAPGQQLRLPASLVVARASVGGGAGE